MQIIFIWHVMIVSLMNPTAVELSVCIGDLGCGRPLLLARLFHNGTMSWGVIYIAKSLALAASTIELPKTVPEALAIDMKNNNKLWADAIAEEMKNVCVAFKILPNRQSAPIGYQKVPCHMVFDMKMEDSRQKARLWRTTTRLMHPLP